MSPSVLETEGISVTGGGGVLFDDVLLQEVMHLVFTRMPRESDCTRFRSLLLSPLSFDRC